MKKKVLNLNRIVTTFDGTNAKRSNCKRIRGQFYEANRQCFYINGEWNRINNGLIVFDYDDKKWKRKKDLNLSHGIVGYESDGLFKYGHFTIQPTRNLRIHIHEQNKNDVVELMLDESILTKRNNKYKFITTINQPTIGAIKLPHKEAATIEHYLKTRTRKPSVNGTYIYFNVDYSSAPHLANFSKISKNHFIPSLSLTKYSELGALIDKEEFTFGLEYETNSGIIPERHLFRNGLIACRDGSIQGFEYVTIPMKGISGIQRIYEHSKLLKDYCKITDNNSMHIHVGGFPINKKSIMAFYHLAFGLQNDIYELFPKNFKDTSTFKQRNYCAALEKISSKGVSNDTQFNNLYSILTMGNSSFEGFTFREHPMDTAGRQKWHIAPRYKWVNVIPLIFGNRGTIEFRVHTPTFNFDKFVYWLLIVQGILKYAKNNETAILKDVSNGTIYSIKSLYPIMSNVYSTYPELLRYLNGYISYRKKLYSGNKDVYGKKEINNETWRLPKELRLI